MLSDSKLSLLHQLVQDASADEIIWTKGYLSGFLDASSVVPAPSVPQQISTVKPTILYGTETGNSKKIATSLLSGFKKHKIQAKSSDIFQYDVLKLQKEDVVLFVVSTQGEGEFPQNAVGFYESLKQSDLNLKHLRFAVFGLGDSSYPLFNNASVLLDAELEIKGARRLLPLVKADVDYTDSIAQWEKEVQQILAQTTVELAEIPKQIQPPSLHKKHFKGTISDKIILNDIGSNKQTYHIEIDPAEAVFYEPGDAIGIVPVNSDAEIERILNYFDDSPDAEIEIGTQSKPASQWLSERNIFGLSKRSLGLIGDLLNVEINLEKADLHEILALYPIAKNATIDSLIALLLPIAPRLYSVASSADAHNGQIHLTVNLNQFTAADIQKYGLASHYLAHLPVGSELELYIHKSPNFKLPQASQDIIMIGPGTGIAPFRSFISHRDVTGAEGRNWLFFGEQHFVHDFYYQTEIQDWLVSGALHKLDVAFSRDQQHKIYVQDRIREKAEEFNQWIQDGASIYICGQKSPMSVDVENAIIGVIASQQNLSETDAKLVLEQLEIQGRYLKDVY